MAGTFAEINDVDEAVVVEVAEVDIRYLGAGEVGGCFLEYVVTLVEQ